MSTLTVPVTADDHQLGAPDGRVTLVEYGDYECPYCAEAQPVVHELLRDRAHELRLVFRHFPLTQVHHHAAHAAEVAEAASAQDAFWAMHDALFAHHSSLSDEAMLTLAEQLHLDANRIGLALAEETYLPAVRADFMGGVRSGVNGTPSFFINGRRYDGAVTVDALGWAIDASR